MNAERIKFIFERSCLRKIDRSKEEVDWIVDQKAKRGDLIYYYKCTFCSRYHLTGNPDIKKTLELV